jgi:hypothetical protein
VKCTLQCDTTCIQCTLLNVPVLVLEKSLLNDVLVLAVCCIVDSSDSICLPSSDKLVVRSYSVLDE